MALPPEAVSINSVTFGKSPDKPKPTSAHLDNMKEELSQSVNWATNCRNISLGAFMILTVGIFVFVYLAPAQVTLLEVGELTALGAGDLTAVAGIISFGEKAALQRGKLDTVTKVIEQRNYKPSDLDSVIDISHSESESGA